MMYSGYNSATARNDLRSIIASSKKGKNNGAGNVGAAIRDVKSQLGVGKKNTKSPLEKRQPGRFIKESVTDTKLAVYEAFDAGQINSDEKDTLLRLLAE